MFYAEPDIALVVHRCGVRKFVCLEVNKSSGFALAVFKGTENFGIQRTSEIR